MAEKNRNDSSKNENESNDTDEKKGKKKDGALEADVCDLEDAGASKREEGTFSFRKFLKQELQHCNVKKNHTDLDPKKEEKEKPNVFNLKSDLAPEDTDKTDQLKDDNANITGVNTKISKLISGTPGSKADILSQKNDALNMKADSFSGVMFDSPDANPRGSILKNRTKASNEDMRSKPVEISTSPSDTDQPDVTLASRELNKGSITLRGSPMDLGTESPDMASNSGGLNFPAAFDKSCPFNQTSQGEVQRITINSRTFKNNFPDVGVDGMDLKHNILNKKEEVTAEVKDLKLLANSQSSKPDLGKSVTDLTLDSKDFKAAPLGPRTQNTELKINPPDLASVLKSSPVDQKKFDASSGPPKMPYDVKTEQLHQNSDYEELKPDNFSQRSKVQKKKSSTDAISEKLNIKGPSLDKISERSPPEPLDSSESKMEEFLRKVPSLDLKTETKPETPPPLDLKPEKQEAKLPLFDLTSERPEALRPEVPDLPVMSHKSPEPEKSVFGVGLLDLKVPDTSTQQSSATKIASNEKTSASSVLPDFVQDHIAADQSYTREEQPLINIENMTLYNLPDLNIEHRPAMETPSQQAMYFGTSQRPANLPDFTENTEQSEKKTIRGYSSKTGLPDFTVNTSAKGDEDEEEEDEDYLRLKRDHIFRKRGSRHTGLENQQSSSKTKVRISISPSVPLDLPSYDKVDTVSIASGSHEQPIPFDLTVTSEERKVPPRATTDSVSKSLPDFLSDGPIQNDRLEETFNLGNLVNTIHHIANDHRISADDDRVEARRSQREVDFLRRQLTERNRQIHLLESEIEDLRTREREDSSGLEYSLIQVEKNLKQTMKRASNAESALIRMKQENVRLKLELASLKSENADLKVSNMNLAPENTALTKRKSSRIAKELRIAANTAENSLRSLLTGLDNLRVIAASVESIHYNEKTEGMEDFTLEDSASGPAL